MAELMPEASPSKHHAPDDSSFPKRASSGQEFADVRDMYPMLAMPSDGKGQMYLPLPRKWLWAGPAFGWYALKYHKAAYMKKFFIDDYPAASLGIIAFSSTISVLMDAFTDPKMAKVTDSCGSQHGRRRPFLVLSAFLVPVIFVLHWVPLVPSGTAASLWFAFFHIAYKLADTLFLIPYDAWGAQLTPSGAEQTRVFMWREVFANGGLLCGMAVLPLLFDGGDECKSTPADGCARAPLIAAFCGLVFSASCLTLAYRGREPSAEALRRRSLGQQPGGAGASASPDPARGVSTVPMVMATFLNAPFRALLLSIVTKALGQDIPFQLLPFMAEWVIGQGCMSSGTMFGVLALTSILATLVSLPLWAALANRIGKFNAYLAYNVSTGIMCLLQLGHHRDTGDCAATALAFPLVFFFGCALGGSFLTSAMVTACVDHDELLSGGRRREAMYMMAVDFLPKFMTIPGEVLPLFFMAGLGYTRPPLDQPSCKFSNYTNSAYSGLSLDAMCTAYYAAEPSNQDLCSRGTRCNDVLANGAAFVCNSALEACGVVQNDSIVWVLRLSFSVASALFILLGVVPLCLGRREIVGATSKARQAQIAPGPRPAGSPGAPPSPPGPNFEVLAHLWPSELRTLLEGLQAPGAGQQPQQELQALSGGLVRRPLLWAGVCLLLATAGTGVVVLGFEDLADDLGASVSPLGLVLVGFGLVGLWFHGSRARAAWKLRWCSISRGEVVAQYNALCPFSGAPPVLDEANVDPTAVMWAACYHRHGRPRDVVRVQRVLRPPAPGPGQLLVRVRAASLNPIDWKTGAGAQAALLAFAWPRVYGFDFSGEVVAAGPPSVRLEDRQRQFAVGDRVFGMICGLPQAHRGTLAEYALVDSFICARCPASASHAVCASLPLVAITATKALRACGLKEAPPRLGERDGPRVLITNGAGGVGTMAIQLAVKLFGASYVATTASAAKAGLCARLGAARVVNYREEDFAQVLASSEEALLFDAILDITDESAKCAALLKRGGALVSIAEGPTQDAVTTWLAEARLDPSAITAGVRPFLLSRAGGALFELVSGARRLRRVCEDRGARFGHVIGTGDGEIMARIAELLAGEQIEPIIDREFPLEDAIAAIEYQATGRVAGKVVVRIEAPAHAAEHKPSDVARHAGVRNGAILEADSTEACPAAEP